METKKTLAVVVAGVVGLAAGIAVRRFSPGAAEPKALEPAAVVVFEKPKSSDSLESLLALDESRFHDRAALWLLDATPAGLADFWAATKARGDSERWTVDFLFARWLALDPAAAKKAAGEEGIASLRWARAFMEPDVMAAQVGKLHSGEAVPVMRALADFHPLTAIKVLAAHPGLGTTDIVSRIALRLAVDDPERALNYMRRHRMGHLPSVMRVWTRNDPAAALEWLKSQPADSPYDFPLDDFIGTLAGADPKLLAGLALKQPVGRIRREMERAVFFKTLETDPGAALVMARATESPRIAAERFAEIGRRQVADHPDLAWGIFAELLEKCPDALLTFDNIASPTNSTGEKVELRGVGDFTRALLDANPARTLDTALAAQPKIPVKPLTHWPAALSRLADDWATRDVRSFAKWLEGHPNGIVHDGGAGLIAWTLASRQNFPEAMRWAEGIGDEEQRVSRMFEVAGRWARSDKNALTDWLKSADLPDEIRAKLNETLEKPADD